MSQPTFTHTPVLLAEVMAQLQIQRNGIYVDGTFGRGGHAQSILAALGEKAQLVVMDKDPDAIRSAIDLFGADSRVTILQDDYAQMSRHLMARELAEKVDGVLLDLGVSSPQLDDPNRGFSFQKNGPLDMRMNPAQGESAAQWLRSAPEKDIARVLWEYGEERFSRRIARKIVESRTVKAIEETASLSALIATCVPRDGKKHPATRSFQAIRTYINRELEHIVAFLKSVFDILTIGGRLLVISFHSLEDRLVKRFLQVHSSNAEVPKGLPVSESVLQSNIRLRVIGKAIKPGAMELAGNARARSAILRVAERVS